MKIHVEFTAQLKAATGKETDEVEVPEGARLQSVLRQLVAQPQAGDPLGGFLFEEDGSFSSSVLLTINEEQVFWEQNPVFASGDRLGVFAPMSGG